MAWVSYGVSLSLKLHNHSCPSYCMELREVQKRTSECSYAVDISPVIFFTTVKKRKRDRDFVLYIWFKT
jgi:hypothetical protein